MKSQKGITLLSLVIYITGFLAIAGIVGTITTYFYHNIDLVDTSAGSAADYNKLNVYLLKQVKTSGVSIYKVGNENSPSVDITGDGRNDAVSFITFQNGSTKNTFAKVDDLLYYNTIKLCENVEKFEINVASDRKSFDILVQIANKQYKTKYALGI